MQHTLFIVNLALPIHWWKGEKKKLSSNEKVSGLSKPAALFMKGHTTDIVRKQVTQHFYDGLGYSGNTTHMNFKLKGGLVV